jgi:alkylation response protein AidB-like acyl-CoA dehydrogenase
MPYVYNPTVAASREAVQAARDIAQIVSEGAAEGERLGRLADSVAQAMLKSRLFCTLVPESLGGREISLRGMYEVVEELSRADGAAGWCASIGSNTTAAIARGLPQQGLVDVFGGGGEISGCGSLAPTAKSVQVDGGYRFSGRFTWTSGSAHAQWFVAGSVEENATGHYLRLHTVPTREAERIDTWQVMGLKGTGSIDLVFNDVFVPAHRCCDMPIPAAGDDGSSGYDPERGSLADNAAIAAAGLAAFGMGIGRRALDELTVLAPLTRRLKAGGTLVQDPAVQQGLGQAEGALRAARAHVMTCLDELERARQAGMVPEHLRVALYEASFNGCKAGKDATLFAFETAGASIVYLKHPLQRCLRDILTGLKHAVVSPPVLAKVGQARFGEERLGL